MYHLGIWVTISKSNLFSHKKGLQSNALEINVLFNWPKKASEHVSHMSNIRL